MTTDKIKAVVNEPQDKEVWITFAIFFAGELCGTPNPHAKSLLDEFKTIPRFNELWEKCKSITMENHLKRIPK